MRARTRELGRSAGSRRLPLQLPLPEVGVAPLRHGELAEALRAAGITLVPREPFVEGGAVALVDEVLQPQVRA